jgi:hypothetical protein
MNAYGEVVENGTAYENDGEFSVKTAGRERCVMCERFEESRPVILMISRTFGCELNQLKQTIEGRATSASDDANQHLLTIT